MMTIGAASSGWERAARAAFAGLAASLVACHWCPWDKDCDRWYGAAHDAPLRVVSHNLAVGPGGALAVAEQVEGFPRLRYAPRPSGTSVDLHAAISPAGFECPLVAVGDRGTILVSEDDGERWSTPATPVRDALRAVDIDCPFTTAAAVGDAGALLVARTNLDLWTPRETGTDRTLRAVALAGDLGFAAGDGGTVLRSLDRADTWAPIALGTSVDLVAVEFLVYPRQRDTAVIAGVDGVVWASDDDGERWREIDTGLPEPLLQLEIGPFYPRDGRLQLSLSMLTDSGVWHWYDRADDPLSLPYPLELRVHSFTEASMFGDPGPVVLVDGGLQAWRPCMTCD
ncbi:hypothetical protein OV203_13415 [Nannocystis sp. ILAH1]|uniref:WD40/YVTN/BNR-like repeat-containing protein n=1 Tax=Nannocystis sp. ILAH1 TaxID=2996789 RepID=UPI00226FF0E7|nr:hypothetical protein [Nannocystis sp. ILAH1]MCY0988131.1 hypothetical protein [Nannocystis sp. ILAH1]